jgi:hypothetical protein
VYLQEEMNASGRSVNAVMAVVAAEDGDMCVVVVESRAEAVAGHSDELTTE